MKDLRNDPAFLRYYAAVLTREANVRQSDSTFCAFLLAGAERAEREAVEIERRQNAQGDLFERAAA